MSFNTVFSKSFDTLRFQQEHVKSVFFGLLSVNVDQTTGLRKQFDATFSLLAKFETTESLILQQILPYFGIFFFGICSLIFSWQFFPQMTIRLAYDLVVLLNVQNGSIEVATLEQIPQTANLQNNLNWYTALLLGIKHNSPSLLHTI